MGLIMVKHVILGLRAWLMDAFRTFINKQS